MICVWSIRWHKYTSRDRLQHLRQRFDGTGASNSELDVDFLSQSPTLVSKKLKSVEVLSGSPSTKNRPEPMKRVSSMVMGGNPPGQGSRQSVHAGDLLVSTGGSTEVYRSTGRTYGNTSTPKISISANERGKKTPRIRGASLSTDDFDLKEEVMSCIAKSIGLLQPPLAEIASGEASPAFPPVDGRKGSSSFSSPFGGLSLLDAAIDDASSMTASSIHSSAGGQMTGLDNEVEILFFPAGSILARAGERNTGRRPQI